MEVNRRKWWIISLAGTVGFFFAIAPVLDPYIVIEIGSGFTLKINDIIMLFLTMLCFSKSYRFERKTGFLCMWLLGLGIIGIFGNLVSNTDMANSFKNLIVWLIYAVCCENRSCYSYRKYGTDSLSSKFRVDKLAINNRINDHIISDILLYGNNNINEIECRYVQNYVEYAKELFAFDMKYKEKRRIFFRVGLQENMLEKAKQFGRLSVAQKLIIGSLRTRLFFPVYLIFLLKGKNEKVKV